MRRFAIILILTGCDPSGAHDAGGHDAGVRDAGRDAASDGGADAGIDGGAGADAGARCAGPPGLYAEGSCSEPAEGVRPYHPRFALWSDGADKERFVYLPAGAQIDTSDPDRWGFPPGTRLYKTFSRAGVRLETRILEKVSEARGLDAWTVRAYAWSADQRSVSEVGPFGALDVLGTEHDVPSHQACVRCHSITQDDVIVGFSAIQLAHDEDGVTLAMLNAEGWLTEPIPDAAVPGDAGERAALGYLHGNCGNCHGGPAPEHGLDLWLRVGAESVTDTATWRTAVCACSVWSTTTASGEVVNLSVAPGDPEHSVFLHRMGSRVGNEMMPPIGSEQVDPDGTRVISEWIASLAADANGCPHGCPFP
jgi:hypothetical protein